MNTLDGAVRLEVGGNFRQFSWPISRKLLFERPYGSPCPGAAHPDLSADAQTRPHPVEPVSLVWLGSFGADVEFGFRLAPPVVASSFYEFATRVNHAFLDSRRRGIERHNRLVAADLL